MYQLAGENVTRVSQEPNLVSSLGAMSSYSLTQYLWHLQTITTLNNETYTHKHIYIIYVTIRWVDNDGLK